MSIKSEENLTQSLISSYSRVRSVHKLNILNFIEKALAVDEEVLQEIERMRKAALLCYVPLYKAGKNQLKNKVQKCKITLQTF